VIPIAGIVLAAGYSRRMGSTKALITLHGVPFAERVVRALRDGGCAPVIVVVGVGNDHQAVAALAESLGALVVVNRNPGSEQLDSLRLGMESVPAAVAGVMVSPVDVPLVSASLVDALIVAFEASGRALALPGREGRHGHPVLFGRSLFDELLGGDLPGGARDVVRAHLDEAVVVEIQDALTLKDVDTPDDLRHFQKP
jgi:CTP:molybdopterin cytidylyltransferase MocA